MISPLLSVCRGSGKPIKAIRKSLVWFGMVTQTKSGTPTVFTLKYRALNVFGVIEPHYFVRWVLWERKKIINQEHSCAPNGLSSLSLEQVLRQDPPTYSDRQDRSSSEFTKCIPGTPAARKLSARPHPNDQPKVAVCWHLR